MYTDSHTHLYLDAFKDDREMMIQRAIHAGVSRMLLPNIDSSTTPAMFGLADRFPAHCFPMLGLHPSSVKENYLEEIKVLEALFNERQVIAVGETGIDLYWDRTYEEAQKEAFRIQIGWALGRQLPLVVHARESFQEIFKVLDEAGGKNLKGVFHSFTGSRRDLEKALSYNFMIGINGISTFKNSTLGEVLKEIPMDRLLLETDAPFLAPVPHRGKRNESSFLIAIAAKLAEVYRLPLEEIAQITTQNANQLFQLNPVHGF